MEETIDQDLFEHKISCICRYALAIIASSFQPFQIIDLDAADTFHDQQTVCRVFPKYFWHIHVPFINKILAESVSIPGLPAEIHLSSQGSRKLLRQISHFIASTKRCALLGLLRQIIDNIQI